MRSVDPQRTHSTTLDSPLRTTHTQTPKESGKKKSIVIVNVSYGWEVIKKIRVSPLRRKFNKILFLSVVTRTVNYQQTAVCWLF
jgi:hypothetical protein